MTQDAAQRVYLYERIRDTSTSSGWHWRVSDPNDNRIATCYSEHNAKFIVDRLNSVDAAVAEAVKERDAEIAWLQAICDDNSHKFSLHQQALIEALREERERLGEELREARFMLDAFKGQHTAEWWEGFRAQVMASYPPASAPEGTAQ